MFEFIAFLIALAGTIIASYYDLKTTEIPDALPIFMIVSGISVNLLDFLISGSAENLILSLMNGVIFSIIGFFMYFGGQWGAGDAFLLSAVGFLIPKNFIIADDFPFFFTYLLNLFLLGSVYMIVYSVVYALKNEKALKMFKSQVRNSFKTMLILFFIFAIASYLFSLMIFKEVILKLVFLSPTISILLILLWLFSKSVEKSFIKRIPVSKLKVGDVLLESKRWDGVTKEEIEKIKKSGRKYVYIKSGICFAPAFPIALLFTMFYGNSVIIFLNLLSLI